MNDILLLPDVQNNLHLQEMSSRLSGPKTRGMIAKAFKNNWRTLEATYQRLCLPGDPWFERESVWLQSGGAIEDNPSENWVAIAYPHWLPLRMFQLGQLTSSELPENIYDPELKTIRPIFPLDLQQEYPPQPAWIEFEPLHNWGVHIKPSRKELLLKNPNGDEYTLDIKKFVKHS